MTLTMPACPAGDEEIALARFLVSHADALISAAALLGGRPAVRRTSRLLQELSDAPTLTRRLRREVIGLYRLLSLECVDDFESLEAQCFAELDPASPEVEQICALTDRLRDCLIALARSEGDEPAREVLGVAA